MERAVRRHVVPDSRGGWSVYKTLRPTATRRFPTEQDALEYAARLAKREGTHVYIHDYAGRVLRKETYGADSIPPIQKA